MSFLPPNPSLRGPARRACAKAATAAAMLAGCADVGMAPYRQPAVPVKAAWSNASASPVSKAEVIAPDWWRQFDDPYLDQLVGRAIGGNIDLKVLAARIGVASAQIGEASAGALPAVDAGAGASFDKSTGRPFGRQFNLGAQTSWDIDVWGRAAKGVQAQSAEFNATEADWRAGYLTIVSDVSVTYFQILKFDEQIGKQQQALEKNRQILSTYQAMEQNGLLPHTRVQQQSAEINQLSQDLIELGRLRTLAGNALATLIGMPAGEFQPPAGSLQERVQVPQVPGGLPSQLLKRRPDIVAAEFRVLGAYELSGQARLAQLPSISLTGRGGTSSFALTDLLRSFTFGLLPSINFPIFDPGVQARIKTSDAQAKVVEQEYRRTVMGAFEEVENALVNLDAHKKQRSELQQRVDQLQLVAAQTDAQRREGVVSQLEVFETGRSLLSAQLALLENHQQILSDTVALYKTLGGGWPPVQMRAQPPLAPTTEPQPGPRGEPAAAAARN
jgi:NodT family efflux transporter outer membrane factor (OMF) lipoprotein